MKNKTRKFTLIELIVAMSVFSILLAILLQFFTGAQRIWTNAEKKNNLYSDARGIMDLMSSLLMTIYGDAGDSEANQDQHVPSVFYSDRMYFATKTNMDLPKYLSNIRFVSFYHDSANNALFMNILCDKAVANQNQSGDDTAYRYFFPPFDGDSGNSKIKGDTIAEKNDTARNYLVTKLDGQSAADYHVKLLSNVTGFSITPYQYNAGDISAVSVSSSSRYNGVPYFLVLQIKMLDAESFLTWSNMPTGDAKDNFRLQHEYQFTRSVYIGNRNLN